MTTARSAFLAISRHSSRKTWMQHVVLKMGIVWYGWTMCQTTPTSAIGVAAYLKERDGIAMCIMTIVVLLAVRDTEQFHRAVMNSRLIVVKHPTQYTRVVTARVRANRSLHKSRRPKANRSATMSSRQDQTIAYRCHWNPRARCRSSHRQWQCTEHIFLISSTLHHLTWNMGAWIGHIANGYNAWSTLQWIIQAEYLCHMSSCLFRRAVAGDEFSKHFQSHPGDLLAKGSRAPAA
mmetsp:Transcript_19803/g.31055  ORF Transcript_19803/g.31055 Transcript_19803/m.31055 type:complete len:235 (-) Transcript_19803:608-1312(-)